MLIHAERFLAASALAALILGTIGTVLTEANTNVTWQQCQSNNEGRVLTTLPDDGARKLFLIKCHITAIQPRDFAGLPNLEWISLEYNKIDHINPIVFKNLTKLTDIFLHFNKITEFPAFNKHPGLHQLELLQMNGNLIKKLDNPKALSPLVKLELLDVSSNQIDYIHEDMFKNSPSLVTLYLMHNKLRYIPEKLFQINRLEVLNLSDNFIEYVPKDSFFGTNFKQLYIQGNRISHLQDSFLSQFTKGTLNIFRFDKNSWQCSCLLELFQEVKTAGITKYKPEKYDGTRKVCVNSERKCNRDNFYPGLSN